MFNLQGIEASLARDKPLSLAALLEWIVKARLTDLLDAGLTHADVFKLVRVADDYRKGKAPTYWPQSTTLPPSWTG